MGLGPWDLGFENKRLEIFYVRLEFEIAHHCTENVHSSLRLQNCIKQKYVLGIFLQNSKKFIPPPKKKQNRGTAPADAAARFELCHEKW